MADPIVLARLREDIAVHLERIGRLFIGPRKISILVRDPSCPDGSRDVYLSEDEPDVVLAAIQQVLATGEETKADG